MTFFKQQTYRSLCYITQITGETAESAGLKSYVNQILQEQKTTNSELMF